MENNHPILFNKIKNKLIQITWIFNKNLNIKINNKMDIELQDLKEKLVDKSIEQHTEEQQSKPKNIVTPH